MLFISLIITHAEPCVISLHVSLSFSLCFRNKIRAIRVICGSYFYSQLKSGEQYYCSPLFNCRGDQTRTGDHFVPNEVRYQLRYTPIGIAKLYLCALNVS